MKLTLRCVRLLPAVLFAAASLSAETCTTQSAMDATVRDGLVRAASALAALAAANNADGVKAQTMPQFASDFSGIAGVIQRSSSHLQGASFLPETVWLLDATGLKAGADGKAQDAQFFCSLNRGGDQTSFSIPSLPEGKYGLVVLNTVGTAEPWQVALLLREGAPGQWQLGGLFPRATTAANHDGLWYWKTARDYATKKQPWNAYVYYTEAAQLLKPVSFVSSTNLEKLHDERSKSAPPALSAGINAQQPLVIGDGKSVEVRVTSLGADNAPGNAGLDLVAHVKVETPLSDPVASRARNAAAAKTIVAAYPELRSAFHGVWIVSEFPDGTTYVSEEPMAGL